MRFPQEVVAFVTAADFIEHRKMRLCTCRYMASLIHNKDTAQIRAMLGLPPETPEEKAEMEKFISDFEWSDPEPKPSQADSADDDGDATLEAAKTTTVGATSATAADDNNPDEMS